MKAKKLFDTKTLECLGGWLDFHIEPDKEIYCLGDEISEAIYAMVQIAKLIDKMQKAQVLLHLEENK